MNREELERIRLWGCPADDEHGSYACSKDRETLLAELDRHMCQCGHWMREHPFSQYTELNGCDECKCGDFEPSA